MSAICVAFCPGTSTTTTERARIFRSTRIARTRAYSCHPGSGESSPSRKSVACITVTNVSPPNQYLFLFAKVAQLRFHVVRGREITGPAISTVGQKIAFRLDCSPDLRPDPIQYQLMHLLKFRFR